MNYLESKEDYLERILILQERNGKVRSIDIANDMSFSKPSVSVAMKKLKELGYITIDDSGYISLTDSGISIARATYDKHVSIYKALIKLGVSEDTAYSDACKIEHELSEESLEKLKEFIYK